jgi:hypothetical protein
VVLQEESIEPSMRPGLNRRDPVWDGDDDDLPRAPASAPILVL